MKKLIVISDTHGSASAFTRVMEAEQTADALIFTGDGCRDLARLESAFPNLPVYAVRGNCDFASLYPEDGLAAFEGVLFYYAHGHAYNVKYALSELARAASVRGADVALFGHSHLPTLEEQQGVTLFNPGSAGQPRYGRPTYGVVWVQQGKSPKFEHKEVPDYG